MRKTNAELVKYAQKALYEKWGYVWGTFGQLLDEKLLRAKISQYPDGVGKYQNIIRSKWMGRKVSDCVGLIKSYLWFDGSVVRYSVKNDVNADGMYAAAIEKGPISTIPEVVGLCLWKRGHIGVYIGNGQVIEARGTAVGVIQSPLKGPGSAGWTHWLKCPFIEYPATKAPYQVTSETLKRGSKGETVKRLQVMLGGTGHRVVADGDFGPVTEAAVRAFQMKRNLEADGVVGPKTWAALSAERTLA